MGPSIRGFCTKPPKAPETKAAPKIPKAPKTKAAPKAAAAAEPVAAPPPPPAPAKPAGPTVPAYVSSATPSAPAERKLKIVYASDQIAFALKPFSLFSRQKCTWQVGDYNFLKNRSVICIQSVFTYLSSASLPR